MIYNWYDLVYQSTPGEIQQFLETKAPWQDKDYYVFPPTLEWCVVYTHEDQIFVTGQFPESE
jgi:hypothetical protein